MRIACLAALIFACSSNNSSSAGADVPDFETQVLPVLTRAGCNAGSCHGAATGRGGFKLSLLGDNPGLDYDAIVRQYEGRRVNLARPEESLVLLKPTEQVFHEGGPQLSMGGTGYQIVRDWIEHGAPRGPSRSLAALEVAPRSASLGSINESFHVTVLARYDDGSTENVTRWAILTPSDESAMEIESGGEVVVRRRGQSAVMVRFLGAVDCVRVTVPLTDSPPPSNRPAVNSIDEHINTTLDALRLPHSPRCDDATFLRRACLDLNGRLPKPDEIARFLADDDPDKRSKLVDRLLDRPEFADLWAYRWGDLLRVESGRLRDGAAATFHDWLRDQIVQKTPLDAMARSMLLATGDTRSVGPANFSRVPTDAREQAELVSRVFMGVRLRCANCHNHPLDRWTQDDYHGLAAVFARIDRGTTIQLSRRGEVIHPRTGEPARPRLPGEAFIATSGSESDPRVSLADWLTAPSNPYFARAAVNRIWASLMGRGLVEPLDDHRATNPATHPELLDALARDFADQGFDLRHSIRVIMASEAYQRSSLAVGGNEVDDRFYSHALVRPLPPHVLVDAVSEVTGIPERLGDLPPGTPARSLGDARIESEPLDLLGRCDRQGDCVESSNPGGSLPLVLHAMHGPWLNEKIAHPEGRLSQLIDSGKCNDAIISTFFTLALGRTPSVEERSYWSSTLAEAAGQGGRHAALEDFVWAMLNSTEFVSNH